MPGIADNALVKAAPLVERIAAYRPKQQVQQEVEACLRILLGDVPPADDVFARMHEVDATFADLLQALLSETFSPTIIDASKKRNVIPALCTIEVDCRLLPGQSPQEIEAVVRSVLGDDVDYELEFLNAEGGTRSPLDTPLWSAIDAWVAEADPEARAVPIVCAGFTDSHWLRQAFGAVAYGFFPSRTMPGEVSATLIHSADERIPVDDLELGLDWLRFAARTVLA